LSPLFQAVELLFNAGDMNEIERAASEIAMAGASYSEVAQRMIDR